MTSPNTPDDSSAARFDRGRAAMVVYRWVNQQPKFLLISSRKNPRRLTLPGGKIAKHESAVETAIRETREESGVLTDTPTEQGFYLHTRGKRRVHPTQTFLAPLLGQLVEHEPRTLHWLHIDELHACPFAIRQPIQDQVLIASDELLRRGYAA